MISWKRNLLVVWLSQFLGIAGFSLSLPFAPFFIQELGVHDPSAVKFWAALSQTATGLSLAIMSPIWGSLADRYGRRIMMLRANFAAAVVLLGMSFAPTVQVFILMRLLQGAFTGTIGAATTFVASSTPRTRQGFALGSLSAAVFSGTMIGPLVGGVLADMVGYRLTFALSSLMLLCAGLLIMFQVRERFVRPSPDGIVVHAGWRSRLAALGPGLPILVLLLFMSVARTFDQPLLPLYVQEIHGRLQGASRITGLVSGIAAVGATLAGIFLGRLADRVPAPLIGKFSAAGAALFIALTGGFPFFAVLIPARFMLAFCAGGLDPVFQIWLSRVTPDSKRGTIFGWAVTFKSIGWAISPLASAGFAVVYGIRPTLFAAGGIFLLLIPMIHVVSKRVLALEESTRQLGPAQE